jgi:GNAT superfamily N-acetyltransferase
MNLAGITMPIATRPTNAQLRQIMLADPVWSVYALADLQPEFAPYCHWQTASVADGRTALTLLYTGLSPEILLTVGDPGLLAQCLDRLAVEHALPDRVYLSIREEHEAPVTRWYDNRADRRPMLRMTIKGQACTPDGRTATLPLIRLGRADADCIRTLYACGGPFTPDAFDPYQLDDGVFFGLADPDGALLAVGGTHIVDWRAGLGAIGNMYTHPQHRGNGYAGAILAAIVTTLRTGGIQTIILNVDQRNTGARRLYETHGFTVHCPYLEGIASLHV